MAGAISLYGAEAMMSHWFGGITDRPGTFYVALCLNARPSPFDSGIELDEPTDALYMRAVVENVSASWLRDYENIVNAEDILFDEAGDEWGSVRYWAICDSATEGHMYYYGDFADAVSVEEGDQMLISAGTLSFTMGPIFSEANDDD